MVCRQRNQKQESFLPTRYIGYPEYSEVYYTYHQRYLFDAPLYYEHNRLIIPVEQVVEEVEKGVEIDVADTTNNNTVELLKRIPVLIPME